MHIYFLILCPLICIKTWWQMIYSHIFRTTKGYMHSFFLFFFLNQRDEKDTFTDVYAYKYQSFQSKLKTNLWTNNPLFLTIFRVEKNGGIREHRRSLSASALSILGFHLDLVRLHLLLDLQHLQKPPFSGLYSSYTITQLPISFFFFFVFGLFEEKFTFLLIAL